MIFLFARFIKASHTASKQEINKTNHGTHRHQLRFWITVTPPSGDTFNHLNPWIFETEPMLLRKMFALQFAINSQRGFMEWKTKHSTDEELYNQATLTCYNKTITNHSGSSTLLPWGVYDSVEWNNSCILFSLAPNMRQALTLLNYNLQVHQGQLINWS